MSHRCDWCGQQPEYQRYHDDEWGRPCDNDQLIFEFLILESAQAGLSWLTILRKREGYRRAFANFDPVQVASFDADKVTALLNNSEIVRHRLKIESAINNAQRFLELQAEFGSASRYFWGFFNGVPTQNNWKNIGELPVTTPQSDLISKDLKRRGFRFFGSTTCYAFLQALGFVNDHTISCDQHQACTELGRHFNVEC